MDYTTAVCVCVRVNVRKMCVCMLMPVVMWARLLTIQKVYTKMFLSAIGILLTVLRNIGTNAFFLI